MSQPSPRVIVSHPIALIVRTPPPIAPFPVCAPPPFVVIVTIPVPDSYCPSPIVLDGLLFLLASCTFLLSLLSHLLRVPSIVLSSYCSLPSYCSPRFTALDGLDT
jgi:hypothetical protein